MSFEKQCRSNTCPHVKPIQDRTLCNEEIILIVCVVTVIDSRRPENYMQLEMLVRELKESFVSMKFNILFFLTTISLKV